MACTVATPLAPLKMNSTRVGMFRGDDDDLVDKLIAACQQVKAASCASYTGFGRDLVPWTDDSAPSTPAVTQDQHRARRSATAPQLPRPVQTKSPQESHKHPRSAVRAPGSPEHKKANRSPAGPTTACNTPVLAPCTPTAAARMPTLAAPAGMPMAVKSDDPASTAFACAAYANSPKPEVMPMPKRLMAKCSRSSSPMKQAAPSPIMVVGMPVLPRIQVVA